MLRDVALKRLYRSGEDELLRDLYLPCLAASARYSRAAGYFSSSSLALAAAGLGPFIASGGTMRLVLSPQLYGIDADLIGRGYEERDRILEETMTGPLLAVTTGDQLAERIGRLAWLIARGRLDIRVAVTSGGQGPGVYHEKLGLFHDFAGDFVAFYGSANESRGGLVGNFESVMVFRSWEAGEAEDAREFEHQFEALWADETPGLEVMPFPTAAREALIELAPDAPPTDPDPPEPEPTQVAPLGPERLQIPDGLKLRPYQREAVASWLRAEGRGLLEMATGSGKTVVALAAAQRLASAESTEGRGLLILILCPYQHLVRQWDAEVRRFGAHPLLCYRSHREWGPALLTTARSLRSGQMAEPRVVIATYDTFRTSRFQSAIASLPRCLLIADEVHNAGSAGIRSVLPNARYRMGLSATPERRYDSEGSASLEEHFGGRAYEFGLAEAIAAGALVPYDYEMSVVELDDDELSAYRELTRRLARSLAAGGSLSDDGPARYLLIARARLIANARNKLLALRRALEPLGSSTHNLIYCGDGSRGGDSGEQGDRQIEEVMRLVGLDLGMRAASYTAETPIAERAVLRERFAAGDLQALVAIRCLDEGVDIPATERAFVLASSTNPRQYVQRRGRVLRRSEETGKRHALVHDFIAVPAEGALEGESWKIEQRLVQRELERAIAFAELARNSAEALGALRELRSRYGL